MGLITCPDCGKQISDLAPTCPNCGRPINNSNVNPADKTNGKKKDSILSIIAAVLAIFVFTSFLGLIIGLIDIGAFRKDGKRHLGSWFAIIIGVAIIILTNGRVMPVF